MEEFVQAWERMQNESHEIAVSKGWFDDGDRNFGELIALCHAELSEALEAARNDDPESIVIEGFGCVEEELADLVIRVMGLARYRGYRVAKAVVAKMEYNRSRPKRHGGKLF